jgi:hypothetical protein
MDAPYGDCRKETLQMDIGNLVNWIRIGLWALTVVGYFARVLGGKTSLPRWIASNSFLGAVILLGAVASTVTFVRYRSQAALTFDQNVKLEQIVDRNFSEEVVDVDGKSFLHCHFHDVKFKYVGHAAFGMKDCGFSGNLLITTDNPSIQGAWNLAKALGMMPHVPFMGPNEESLPVTGPTNQPPQLR